MKFKITVFLILVTFIFITAQAQSFKKGDIVFSMDFENATDRAQWTKADFASWAHEKERAYCLKVNVAAEEKPGHHKIKIPFDIEKYRGYTLIFKCLVKAENVTKAPKSWNGIKYMLHYKNRATGDKWHNKGNIYGTFAWKEIEFVTAITKDAMAGDLTLGLEKSTGTAWFDNLSVTIARAPVTRPEPKKNAGPVFKGHNIPRMRGVMSPHSYKPDDFKTMSEWKINLVRWQMTRKWGQANTDMDLKEYDQWIKSEITDLDRALNAALKYGIKIVIDLHSPPGGRYEDRSMRMFYEKKYQRHFVKVWQRFATHYKGHPAIYGYDLVNEPVEIKLPNPGMGYLATQILAAKAIRKIDSKTPIIIESAESDSPNSYTYLEPVEIPNVIYQVHMYQPGSFTHQGIHGNAVGIKYPGVINNILYNKARLKKILGPVRKFQLAYNVHIYVGEFSAARWAIGAADYLSDLIEIFEEYDWDWTYHAFREASCWSVEYENTARGQNKKAVTETDRAKVLKSWFAKNKIVSYPDAKK